MKASIVYKCDRFGRHKKKGTARLFVLGAAFAVSTLAATPARAQGGPLAAVETEAQQQVTQFTIAPGPLSDVIAEFQKASGTPPTTVAGWC